MSKASLVNFLTKIDDELNRGGASDAWRTKTGNKLTTTITVSTVTITKTIKAAVSAATNVSKNGDILIKDLGPKYTALTTALMVFSTAFGTALFGILIDIGFSIEQISLVSGVYISITLILLFFIRNKLNPKII